MNDDDDKKVFIGYFNHTVPSEFLKQMFAKFGQIKSFWKSPSVPRTFAFVVFRTAEAAENSVQQLNGIYIGEIRVKVNLAKDKDQEFLANISAESCSSCSEDECCLNKENGHKKHKKKLNDEKVNHQLNKNQINFKNSFKSSKSATDLNDEINNQQLNSYDDTDVNRKGKKSKFRYFNQNIVTQFESDLPKPAKHLKNDSSTPNKKIDQQSTKQFNNQQNLNQFSKQFNNQQNLNQFSKQFKNQQNLNQFSKQFNQQKSNKFIDPFNSFNESFNNLSSSQLNKNRFSHSKNYNKSNLQSNQYYNPFNLSKASTSPKSNKISSPENNEKQRKKSKIINKSALIIDLTSPAASPFDRINTKTGEIDIEDTLDNNELNTSIKKFEVITIDDD